jgi:hypothetical protein
VTAHALRHTAASLAISAGANPKVVQRMLGHASAAMTLDVFADLFASARMLPLLATVAGISWPGPRNGFFTQSLARPIYPRRAPLDKGEPVGCLGALVVRVFNRW